MTVHLLDRHPGHHRAHRAQPSRPHPLRRLRVLLEVIELWTRWWNWPPVQAHYDRQYKRADRKAFAAEMAALPSVSEGEIREAREYPWQADSAPDEDGLNRYRAELDAALGLGPIPEYPAPGSHPYPDAELPVWFPRTEGDGLIVLGPDGCIQIRRPEWTRTPETSCDLQALPVVPRYLDAMPGGTE